MTAPANPAAFTFSPSFSDAAAADPAACTSFSFSAGPAPAAYNSFFSFSDAASSAPASPAARISLILMKKPNMLLGSTLDNSKVLSKERIESCSNEF